MTNQRKEYRRLNKQLKEIQAQIKRLKTHPNGKSYGFCVRKLIQHFIDPNFEQNATYEMHHQYEKLHAEISKHTGTKTQIFTEDEYKLALQYMQDKWNYAIPEEYQL